MLRSGSSILLCRRCWETSRFAQWCHCWWQSNENYFSTFNSGRHSCCCTWHIVRRPSSVGSPPDRLWKVIANDGCCSPPPAWYYHQMNQSKPWAHAMLSSLRVYCHSNLSPNGDWSTAPARLPEVWDPGLGGKSGTEIIKIHCTLSHWNCDRVRGIQWMNMSNLSFTAEAWRVQGADGPEQTWSPPLQCWIPGKLRGRQTIS